MTAPAGRECLDYDLGLLDFAILSGRLFARFTRPTARIRFSRHAILAPCQGGWALMFRLANLRNHDLTDARRRRQAGHGAPAAG